MIGNKYAPWRNSDQYEDFGDVADPRNPCNYNQRGRDWERPCNIQVFKNGQLQMSQDVGMRISGNYSRCNPQKSITFYARKEYSKAKMNCDFFNGKCTDINGDMITRFDKVTLRNGGNDSNSARYRDDLVADLMSDLNVSSMCKADYILFINGEFWGYYSLQEKLGDEYAESHYGTDAEKVTCIKNGQWDGDESVCNEYLQFYDWVMYYANLSDPADYRTFAETVDIESLIDCIVIESYINNWDFGANINNWMIWRTNEKIGSSFGDGRWRFMVYDTEFSMGLYGSESTQYSTDFFSVMDTDPSRYAPPALFMRAMENDEFSEAFYSRYVELMNTVFLPENVIPQIDRHEEGIRDAFYDTVSRFNMWENLNGESETIREYFRKRPQYALLYLNRLCGVGGTDDDESNSEYACSDWYLWSNGVRANAKTYDIRNSRINVESTGQESWYVQYICETSLTRDKLYTFSFNVKSPCRFAVCIQENCNEYETFYYREYEGTNEDRRIDVIFDVYRDCPDAKIAFICGYETGEYIFHDMSLKQE